MKKLISVLCTVAMIFSLCACSQEDEIDSDSDTIVSAEETDSDQEDYSNSTLTGQVTAVEGTVVTLTLGELTEVDISSLMEEGGMGGMEGELPGDAGEGGGMPDGEMPDGEMPDGEMPDGEAGDGEGAGFGAGETFDWAESGTFYSFTAGEETAVIDLSDGTMSEDSVRDSVDDIAEGDVLIIEVGDDNEILSITVVNVMEEAEDMAFAGDMASGGMGGFGGTGGSDMGGFGMGGSSSGGVDSYDAVLEFTSDTTEDGGTYTSTGTDENAILVSDGATVSISDATITRDSDDSTGGDNSSFYGVGASVLVTDGTLYLSDSTVNSDAAGGAGVFAYGDGVVYVSDTEITTQQDTSGGIHVAGGGTLYAWDLTVETNGESSAAIRSDRGAGTMVVDGGTYISNWTGSPAVYSTADITVHDATLTANGSEAICIEGLNTIRLFDCDVTGSMQDLSTNDCTWNVILYQSMSGDSEVGNSTFLMVGGSLTATNGGMFYTTNTESTFVLSDVDITYAEDSEFLLKCTGNSNSRGWGTTGSNGADCLFTAICQELEGAVIWDSISQLDLYLLEGSTLTGYVVDDETNAGNSGDGYANMYIDADSTWIVTGDSVLTNLYCEGTIVDEDGNSVTIVRSDGTTYINGSSAYTITVDNYSTTVDVSGAASLEEWADYEVEQP